MGNFDIETQSCDRNRSFNEECIIAYKIYDQCRLQNCLTPSILGPARAARCAGNCNDNICDGDIIVPPCNAAAVSIKDLELCSISIVNKSKNPFKPGFWDIEVKYVFVYTLVFRTADYDDLCCIRANSTYTTKVTLFGSIGTDVLTVTDLFGPVTSTDSSGPYVTVDGKAVALAAELKYCSNNCNCGCNNCGCNNCGCNNCTNNNCGCNNCGCNDCGCCVDSTNEEPVAVNVTIGLFSIVKIFHPINMLVHSTGICVPEECEGVSSSNPCDFFNSIDFPMNVFSPPGSDQFNCDCNNKNCNTCRTLSSCNCK